MKKLLSILDFEKVLNHQLLDLVFLSATFFTLTLGVFALPFGYFGYCALNLITALLCFFCYIANRKKHHQFAYWFGTSALSLLMVVYTYFFGLINAHMYLLAGMVTLSYFSGNKGIFKNLIWVSAGILFIFCFYLLQVKGRIVELNELESILFYPNLVFSMVLLLAGTFLFRERHKRQQKILNESIEVKTKMISLISHDLRSPFNTLYGIIELLESDSLTQEELKNSISYLKTKVKTSNLLIENVLHWASSQQYGLKPTLEKLNLNDLINNSIELYKQPADLKNISIEYDANNCFLDSDKEMLSSVIRNILSNAIKFCPKNSGKINITHQVDPQNNVAFSIKDNGPGMPRELIENNFAKINSRTGTDNEQGFGLGLQLVSGFCEKMGIKITINSQKGVGTEFKLLIPQNN